MKVIAVYYHCTCHLTFSFFPHKNTQLLNCQISKGDIQNITYTSRSKASSHVHPTSKFTAAVQDIEDGLVDMSVGPFWITG